MGKRGPKRIPTELLAKRGSPVGKKRLREAREAARKQFATGIWDVAATVGIDDKDNIRVKLTSDAMAEDFTILFVDTDTASKKAVQKAFGINPKATAKAASWEVDATIDFSNLEAVSIELYSDAMITDLIVTFVGSDAPSKKAIQKAFGIPPIPA